MKMISRTAYKMKNMALEELVNAYELLGSLIEEKKE